MATSDAPTVADLCWVCTLEWIRAGASAAFRGTTSKSLLMWLAYAHIWKSIRNRRRIATKRRAQNVRFVWSGDTSRCGATPFASFASCQPLERRVAFRTSSSVAPFSYATKLRKQHAA